MSKILFLFFTLLSLSSFAQTKKSFLYSGKIDNNPVTLYMTLEPSQCTNEDEYMAVYQYGNGKGEKWIQLDIRSNRKNNNLCMTEYTFTGVMVVQKSAQGITGIWISPDGKKQLKVELTAQSLSATEKERLEKVLEIVNFENNDC